MDILTSDLEKQGYRLLDRLEHDQLAPFIQLYLYKKRTSYAYLYYGANLIALGLIPALFLKGNSAGNFEFGEGFYRLGLGFALAFALVPLHEYIHVLAYRSQGARNTSYAMDLKKFIFLAVADRFVADRKEFRVVALAPFAVISGILLAAMPFAGTLWSFTLAGILFTHTAFCAGDFGLLGYFRYHRDKTVVTYDDAGEKVSYFFGR
ncbi:MAG TPA: DUF3267 domain-containing protein [Flavilitoribacter sp.]|nr:DUF3267 domain-containing protein [Flavilitoribacter sp.]HMQ88714.1 DUF3267 domain-containing protein [Flavilitoribacter sp.]